MSPWIYKVLVPIIVALIGAVGITSCPPSCKKGTVKIIGEFRVDGKLVESGIVHMEDCKFSDCKDDVINGTFSLKLSRCDYEKGETYYLIVTSYHPEISNSAIKVPIGGESQQSVSVSIKSSDKSDVVSDNQGNTDTSEEPEQSTQKGKQKQQESKVVKVVVPVNYSDKKFKVETSKGIPVGTTISPEWRENRYLLIFSVKNLDEGLIISLLERGAKSANKRFISKDQVEDSELPLWKDLPLLSI